MDVISAAELYTEVSLPAFSLEVSAIILFVCLPAALVIGYSLGKSSRNNLLRKGLDTATVVSETTMAALLALLGLLIAFSFSHALNLANKSKAAVINEAAALGTVFSRADFLNETDGERLQLAILEYSRTRLIPDGQRLDSEAKVRAFLDASFAAQSALWPLTVELIHKETVPPATQAFVASAMNHALDAGLDRMQTLSKPVSELFQFVLLSTAISALFLLGNRAGLVGRRMTWRAHVFSGVLFMVLYAIVDTQRSEEGFVRLDQGALKSTIFEMESALNTTS